MTAQIDIREPGGETDPAATWALRVENTVNSPVVSAALAGPVINGKIIPNGQQISGSYELTFANNAGAVSCTVVTDDGDHAKNPHGGSGLPVIADGASVNAGLVPGVDIVVSAAVDTGWMARISIGALMATDGSTSDRLNIGIVLTGESSTQRRLALVNVGDEEWAGGSIEALPGIWWTPVAAQEVVSYIRCHPDTTRDDLAVEGEYELTFAAWGDGVGDDAGYKVCNVLVDGTPAITGARLDGETEYGYGLHPAYTALDLLRGLAIQLPLTETDPTPYTVTLTVRDGDDWMELAPDVSGAPGVWTSGALSVGALQPAGIAYVWVRWSPPVGTPPGALRAISLRRRGLSI